MPGYTHKFTFDEDVFPKFPYERFLEPEPSEKFISGKRCRNIGKETERVYTFEMESGPVEFSINLPHWLWVKDEGYHVIVDRDGFVHHMFEFVCFRFKQQSWAQAFDF